MLKKEAEDPEVIQRRWDKKKEQIEILANNIQKLRYNVTLGLKDTDNEKVFLTALVVAIILETSERVGNEASAKNNHVGITFLRKRQISIDGNKVTLEYTGKSGVEHIKSFSDEKIAKALKLAIKRSKTYDVFCTSEGFKIKSMRVNNFLSDFSVRSKDIRGYQSNNIMLEKLKNSDIEDNEAKRKKFFMQSLRKTAMKIGHGASTLRKHYLIPELETNYIKNGTIINLNERDSYEDGGEIRYDNEFSLNFYRVSADSDNDSKEIYFGNDYDRAKSEYDSANVSDFLSDNGGLVMFQKYTNKYKFIYELDEEFETIEDYPIEDYYNDSDYYKLIEEGEYEGIENRDVKHINKESDDLLMDVENHYKKVHGNYKYNTISVNNEKDEYDDDYKEYGCIQLRISDHSENVKNIDKFGSCDYYISVIIANKNKTANKFLTSIYERRINEIELSFDSDDSFEDIISEIDEKIKEGKEYVLDKNGIETFEKGGTLSNIEFKCDYEKYFEYVPLSEIEKYIEFDREVEHKISKKYLDELTKEIKVNGITYPITLEIYDGKGLIVEGNHRIAVAKRLGIKYIPIRVIERYRPFTGTIYEDKVKELPSSSNVSYAKAMYGVQPLYWENSAAVFGFTKVEPKYENGGEIINSDNLKKWFNGSKVIDEFVKPKIVYHGTNRKFNIFDSKEIGQGTGNFGHYGYGFYFSDDIREAKGYGDIILECYLNIKKPFTGTDEEFDLLKEAGFSGIENKVPLTINFNDLHQKIKLIDSNAYEFMIIAKEHGIDNVWSIYLESHPHPHNHKIDLNDIYDMLGYTDLFNQNNSVPDYIIDELNSFGIKPKLNYGYPYSQSLHWVTDLGNNSQDFTDFIKSLGYDGVIYGSEYVAFHPNQIKLADGTNRNFDSENPDIRFEQGGEIEKITFDNFHKGTKADFKEILKAGVPKRKPDFVSESGSKYWFTANSIIRQSDHWGQLDTCNWTLDGKNGYKITQGICKIIDFKK